MHPPQKTCEIGGSLNSNEIDEDGRDEERGKPPPPPEGKGEGESSRVVTRGISEEGWRR